MYRNKNEFHYQVSLFLFLVYIKKSNTFIEVTILLLGDVFYTENLVGLIDEGRWTDTLFFHFQQVWKLVFLNILPKKVCLFSVTQFIAKV